MLISTRIRQNPLLIIAKDHHKMVLLIDPEPVIHQDDKRKTEIDVLSNILKAPRILSGLQPLPLGVKYQIKVQGSLRRSTVNFIRDLFRRCNDPPKIENPGKGSRPALVCLLRVKWNIPDDSEGLWPLCRRGPST